MVKTIFPNYHQTLGLVDIGLIRVYNKFGGKMTRSRLFSSIHTPIFWFVSKKYLLVRAQSDFSISNYS
jgi:hypothetical protein